MNTYRTDLACDGWFDVIETLPGMADAAISRHETQAGAREWLEDHLKLISLDDLAPWVGEERRKHQRARADVRAGFASGWRIVSRSAVL
jgi:hypothetical protein